MMTKCHRHPSAPGGPSQPHSALSSLLGPRFEAALKLSIALHRNDARKGKNTPMISHLLGVCSLVLQDGGNEDEAIAALLHDSLEDHPEEIRPEEIKAQFGEAVLSMVLDVPIRQATTSVARSPSGALEKRGTWPI